jgi:GH24 family phage-related lysozyme (muramidase)
MNISTTGKDLIKKYEGCKLDVYGDANGYPTVGYGHKLSDTVYSSYKNKNLPTKTANKELKAAGLSYTSPIEQTQANTLLTKDLTSVDQKVDSKNEDHYNKFTQNQFDALCSLTFNVPKALSSNDMTTLLNKSMTYSDYGAPMSDSDLKTMAQAVTNAFLWTKADGERQAGLVNRRNAEMKLFCTGMKYSYNKIPYTE